MLWGGDGPRHRPGIISPIQISLSQRHAPCREKTDVNASDYMTPLQSLVGNTPGRYNTDVVHLPWIPC